MAIDLTKIESPNLQKHLKNLENLYSKQDFQFDLMEVNSNIYSLMKNDDDAYLKTGVRTLPPDLRETLEEGFYLISDILDESFNGRRTRPALREAA